MIAFFVYTGAISSSEPDTDGVSLSTRLQVNNQFLVTFLSKLYVFAGFHYLRRDVSGCHSTSLQFFISALCESRYEASDLLQLILSDVGHFRCRQRCPRAFGNCR